ncbi:unnamed protein product [Euphydryas editha]|uniref:Uncharacterized protein n=1 Tax=Euphydryas editha TaxID=104508 RepID=A0AAU9UD21_EUPED|nr:unnamed protein product [Euphydryas editha]
MFFCKKCENEARDGANCSLCRDQFDFPCSGISEAGWRKRGERQRSWKYFTCKSLAAVSPRTGSLKNFG